MKTTIKLPTNLIETKIAPTRVATLIIIITFAILLWFSSNLLHLDSNSSIALLLKLLAVVGFTIAAARAGSLKEIIFAQSGSPLVERTIEFPESLRAEATNLIATQQWKKVTALSTGRGSGSVMRVELIYSKDKRFAAYQIFHYVPHLFEPCSEIIYINQEDISKMELF